MSYLNSQIQTDVLVVGAGPVGLTAACGLAGHGMRVRIIDRKPEPSIHSKALGVHARTLELFEKIGITEPLLAAGVRVKGLNVYDGKRRLARIAVSPLDTPYPFVLSVPQSQTERILAAALRQYGVQVDWRTTFEGLSSGPESVVAHLRLPRGQQADCRSAWLIGCDGADSTVRHALNLSFSGRRFPEWFALADVTIDRASFEREPELAACEARVFFSPYGLLLMIPLQARRQFRIVLTLPEQAIETEPHLDLALFQRALNDRASLDLSLSDAPWISAFRIHRRIVSDYRWGRVFFAGDAAHVHSPVGAQGMNLGIHDAFNLAWKLALVHKRSGRSELLDSYEAERKPAGQLTLSATGLATLLVTLRSRPARRLRNALISLLAHFEFIRRRFVRTATMIGRSYRHSSIVAEGQPSLVKSVLNTLMGRRPGARQRRLFLGGPRAGERAPDAMLQNHDGGSCRIFELLHRENHVLLGFTGRNPTKDELHCLRSLIAEVIQRYPDLIAAFLIVQDKTNSKVEQPCRLIADRTGDAHRRYGADGPCIYLLRPDGYIGWRGMTAAGAPLLMKYLGKYYLPTPRRNRASSLVLKAGKRSSV